MGTKTFNNYESLLTFTRASKGHALRPVSYGDELVDTANAASSWTAYGTNTVTQNGDAIEVAYVDNVNGALDYLSQAHGTSEDLVAGKLYRLTFSAKTNQGSVRFQLYDQSVIIEEVYVTNTEYKDFAFNFISDGSQHLIKLNDMGTGEVFSIKNISVKEVTFDQSGGRLTLFEHPNNVPRVEYVISDNKARFANINNHLLSASIGVEPQSTEFDVLVGGRKIGDITNNGDVSAFDASQYLGWFDGTLTNQTYIDYIEGTLNPYIEENLEKYVLPYPAGINRLGLLVEESRTNLVTYSEDISQYTKVNSPTITTNIATAPDGTETVDGIQDASGGAFRRAKMFQGSVTANSTQTGSLFVKKETSETNYGGVTLNFTGGTSKVCYGIIDAVNGTITAPSSGNSITPTFTTTEIGDFWRFSITATDTGSNTQLEFGVYGTLSTNGTTVASGAGSVRRIWGAQLEAGSFPTSYIKTTGSTATRSVDVATIGVADFGDNIYEGTIFFEGQDIADNYGAINTDGGFSVWFGSNTNNYVAGLYHGTSGLDSVAYYKGSGTLETADANLTFSGGDIKTAMAFDLGKEVAVSINGSTAVTETATVPTAYNSYNWKIKIGSNTSSTQTNTSVYMREIKFYPRRLTNAQLQDLTT